MPISVCVCGSMTFIDQMEGIGAFLMNIGYQVTVPRREEKFIDWQSLNTPGLISKKREFIDSHIAKIRQSNAVIIANYTKHDVEGYIGPNTLMEAAFGHCLGIPVYFLNDPIDQNCGLECVAISSGHLSNSIENFTSFVPPSD